MSQKINISTILYALGCIQPATLDELLTLVNGISSKSGVELSQDDVREVLSAPMYSDSVIEFVWNRRRLLSLSEVGGRRMSRPLRFLRDKTRAYLLKNAHGSRLMRSRAVAEYGMAGDSPASPERTMIEGTAANKAGPAPGGPDVPKEPSTRPARPARVRPYWPRFARQFRSETGLSGAARDTLPPLFSVPGVDIRRDLNGLKREIDFGNLAMCVGLSPHLLARIAFNPARYYRTFELPKPSGGTRIIETPRVFLKVIQWFLLDTIVGNLRVSSAVHSFIPGRSIVTNALRHERQPYVGNIDIENYFGSISEQMVRWALEAGGLSRRESSIVGALCTKGGHLPQGAPTSPALSNSVLYEFDEEMTVAAGDARVIYTRYADDMTFSGANRADVVNLMELAANRLRSKFSLVVNEKKTRIAGKSQQHRVTGVIVNDRASPPRTRLRKIRAIFHQASLNPMAFRDRFDELSGYVGYVRQFPKLKNAQCSLRYIDILKQIKPS